MKFTPNNVIQYAQDSEQFIGIPHAVDFSVEKLRDGMYRLTADNFGCLHKGHGLYGAGPLYVWGLSEEQTRLLDVAADESYSADLAKWRSDEKQAKR